MTDPTPYEPPSVEEIDNETGAPISTAAGNSVPT